MLLRFIPTRMGNTIFGVVREVGRAVHPHTHGEHWHLTPAVRTGGGSSPHAWGTLAAERRRRVPCRFIPTRMGNTMVGSNTVTHTTVHPHTHGEHGRVRFCSTDGSGSSPHAWGTQRRNNVNNLNCRFIPTRMGNTTDRDPSHSSTTVHPHTHGEHCYDITNIWFCAGSSPHAWGTPARW